MPGEEKMMMGMIGVVVMAAVAQQLIPKKTYCCPICSTCFYTYDELHSHFTTQHPAEDIDIIWE